MGKKTGTATAVSGEECRGRGERRQGDAFQQRQTFTLECRRDVGRYLTAHWIAGLRLVAAPMTSNNSAGTTNESETVLPEPPSSSDCIIASSCGFAPEPSLASARNPRTTSRRLLAD